ncbi:DUF2934 domain-containing protein [Sorangium sp. So ce394]|uniref:DUF2934 domain-containing protein n=1 Tax=Sorangium sp. So ce394 TaxID=3133310 RepID=UPI003F5BD229
MTSTRLTGGIETIFQWKLGGPPTRHLGSPSPPRRCRFCGRTERQTSFAKEAHVVPEFLGNRDLITREECDECNKDACDEEGHLATFLAVDRAFAMIRSARRRNIDLGWGEALPKSLARRRTPNTSAGQLTINIDTETVNVSLARTGLHFEANLQPYKPAMVARALARILVRAVPSEHLSKLKNLVALLRGRWDRPCFMHGPADNDDQLVSLEITTNRRSLGLELYVAHLRVGASETCFVFPVGRPKVELHVAPGRFVAIQCDTDTIDHAARCSWDFVPVRYMPPTEDDISRAAYFRWLNNGCRQGTALEDWLSAERSIIVERLLLADPNLEVVLDNFR